MSWKKISEVDRDAITINESSTPGDHARKYLTDKAQAAIADLDLDSMTGDQLDSLIRDHEIERDRISPRIGYASVSEQLRHVLSDDHNHSEFSLERLRSEAPHLFKEDGSINQDAVRRPHALDRVSLRTFVDFMNNHTVYHTSSESYLENMGGVPNHVHPGDDVKPSDSDPLTRLNSRIQVLNSLRRSYRSARPQTSR